MKAPYDWVFEIGHLQRHCRLVLQIERDNLPLSFDDAIDFKIEIAKVVDGGASNELHGRIDGWKTKFFPNKGGFSIEIRHPVRPIQTLALNAKQTAVFSQGLQDFIDRTGHLG